MEKDKKGFTLVELLVVIAIIALLMVIAIPSILLVSRRINNRQYNTKVELILSAAEIYGKDHYAILFADGATSANIKVKDLVPAYLEADIVTVENGVTTYTVVDPRDNTVSMNEYGIYLVIRNSKVVASMDENSIDPDAPYDPNDLNDPRNPNSPYNPNNPNYNGGRSPEDAFDFSNGHVIVVAYLDGELFTTEQSVNFPKPSEASINYTKSRCNAGARLTVSIDDTNDLYKASVSNVSKQTICMLYFNNTSGGTINKVINPPAVTRYVTLSVNGGTATNTRLNVSSSGTASTTVTPRQNYTTTGSTISCTNGATASFSGNILNIANVTSDSSCTIDNVYRESLLNGAYPRTSNGLIPVILSSTEEDWTVKYASKSDEWYKYGDSKWANAVILVSSPSKTYNVGDTIEHSDIAGYFVWIPKYKYKLFNMGNYTTIDGTTTNANHSIDIVFGTENTTDGDTSCATPMNSGASGNCAINKYMTHPSFISLNKNGFWVGKFEVTGSISALTVLPGENSVRSQTVSAMFTNAYNYKRTLDSHMMKNTEWGAVAYLGNSNYGIGNTPVWKNNNSNFVTGCTGDAEIDTEVASCENAWYTTTGKKGSVTGNITGVYDMSGGALEYMAAYRAETMGDSGFTAETIAGYNAKYFDVYPNDTTASTFNKRILGDATGELGPINSSRYSSWYDDCSRFVNSSYPWFIRGGRADNDVIAGSFAFYSGSGGSGSGGFRLVLSP